MVEKKMVQFGKYGNKVGFQKDVFYDTGVYQVKD